MIKVPIAKRLTEGDYIMDKKDREYISEGSRQSYRKQIIKMVSRIKEETLLQRILRLTEYLYIHKEK